MRKIRKQNRWLALALCLCLLASVFPLSGMTYAAGTGCNHQHDTACGYIEAAEGKDCTFTHAHDDTCGWAQAKEAAPCSVEAAHTVHDETCGGDPDTGEGCAFTHEHDDACGYTEAKEAAPCAVEAQHRHDAAVCGFVEAVQGALCNHVHDETCGGLQAEPTACTLTEDCKLPAGHEGACELPTMLGDPPNNTTAVDSGNCGWNGADNMQWSLGTDGVLTISGSGTMGSYYYMGDSQPPWIKYSAQITSIIIEAGVAGIGGHAFYFCTNLTSVTFPESLQSIDTSAFYQCTGLTSATFPNNLQTISDAAFYNCTSLDTLTFLGNTPPKIGPNAFYGVSATGDIHYPAGADEAYTEDWRNGTTGLSGWTLTEQSGPVADEYHPGDVAVIQGIIDNNNLRWERNNPASWNTTAGGSPYLQWDDSTPKRIKKLIIFNIGLSGTLNVSGLTSLQVLDCGGNNLDALNLTGLNSLEYLSCDSNDLGELDLTGLNSLQELYCYSNDLSELDLTGLNSLQELYCYSNNLGELDLTGLNSLQILSCHSNPFQSLKLPGGETLTVNIAPANSGTVTFSHGQYQNLLTNKNVILTPAPEPGHIFKDWSGDASGSDNPCSFTLDSNKSITANFAVDPATTLTVDFNDNKSGGNSLDENEMKTAVETALGGGDKTKITAIRLTGRAAEITGYNWKYLLNLYRSGSDWTNLTVMDLSGMGSLTKVENEKNGHYLSIHLSAVHFPASLQTIGREAFYSCTGLQSVSFPEGLQTIGDWAFSNCTGLQSVSFPEGLQTIGDTAFSSCTGLTAFAVSPDNQQFASEDGVLYDKGMETLLQYPMAKSGTSFAIPDTVKTIGDSAFSNCAGLQSASFPEGLQTIGNSAFYNCAGLQSASFPEGLQTIGIQAFSNCAGLQSASFPEGLQTIRIRAFSNCAGLTSMTFLGEAPPSLGTNAFGDARDGSSVPANGTLYRPARAAAAYASGTFGSPALNGWTRKSNLVEVPGVANGSTVTFAGNEWVVIGLNGEGVHSENATMTLLSKANLFTTQFHDSSSEYGGSTLHEKMKEYYNGLSAADQAVILPRELDGVRVGNDYDTTLTGDHFVWPLSEVEASSLPDDILVNGAWWWLRSASSDLDDGAGAVSYYGDIYLASVPYDWGGRPALTLNLGSVIFASVSAGENGSITPSGTVAVPKGGSMTFTLKANDGYQADQLLVNGQPVTLTGDSYTLTGAANCTVEAKFQKKVAPPPDPTYRLTISAGSGGTVSGTPSGNYAAGAAISVTATADPGYTFTGWTANGTTLGSASANPASFQMPANTVTLTATFTKDSGGGSDGGDHDHSYGGWVTDKKPTETDSGIRHRDCKVCNYRQTESLDPTGPGYKYRTLTDKASGVKVSGYFTDSGLLEVKEMLLHLQGDCDVCDDIRQRQKNGELIVLFDVSLKSGKYKGELDVEIPVGEQYNGQTAIMLHCKDKVLESRTVTVSGGVARGTFSSLSPYAVAKVPGSTAITGLPESYTLLVGQTVSWTPAPAGGAWSYDKDLLSMTKDGDTYTFKALKTGKATATYTADGVPHTITITVNSSTIPQTGDISSPWPWTLLMLASLLGCAGLLVYKKRSKKA